MTKQVVPLTRRKSAWVMIFLAKGGVNENVIGGSLLFLKMED